MSEFYPARSWDDPVSVGLFVVHIGVIICLCANTIFFVTYKQRNLKTKIMFGAFNTFLIIILSAYLLPAYRIATGVNVAGNIAKHGVTALCPIQTIIQLEVFKSFIEMANRKWITLWRIKCLQVILGIVYLLPILAMIVAAASFTVGAFGSSIS